MSRLADRLRRSLADFPHRDSSAFVRDQIALADDSFTPAAVLIAVVDAPEPRVLLTMRRADLRQHPGQVAFPGGRIDPGDDGPVAAALREAWEEVGLDADQVDVVGTARPYRTHSGFHIVPVIGVIPEGLPLAPHEAEVATLFEVPFDHLFAAANHLLKSWGPESRQYYEIDWPHQRIWGVTAGIIVDLAPRLAGVMANDA